MCRASSLLSVAWAAAVVAGCGGDGADAAGDAGDAGGPPTAVDGGASSWSPAPGVLGGPIQETAAVALDGRIYVLGGFTDNGAVSARVLVFDIASASWSMGAELPLPVHHANAAVVGDTIYVLGALTDVSFSALGRVWAWNPSADDVWSERATMPAGSERGASVTGVLEGRVYVAGGLRRGAVADVSMYDPEQDTWTSAAPLPAPRDHACGGVLDGALHVAGGRQTTIGSTAASLEVLDPMTGWSTRPPMPTARGGAACGVVGGTLIVAGGEGNPDASSGVFAQVEAYDPSARVWTTLEPMPTPRHGMAAAGWDGRLYLPGGATVQGFGASDRFDVLTP